MFRLRRIWLSETFPLSVINIDLPKSVTIEDVEVTAALPEETLAVYGLQASFSFLVGSTVYPFPLQGEDFLTTKRGTLRGQVTQSLQTGVYRAELQSRLRLPGVCGYMPCGLGQAGNALSWRGNTTAFVIVQQLGAGVFGGVRVGHGVQTVIRPY